VPHDLNTSTREWALVQGRDGFAIFVGKHDSVSLPADVRVLAHNHPAPVTEGPDAGRIGDLPADAHGMDYQKILADPDVANKAGIVPSTRDIHAISDGGAHVIYTRYVHLGGGKVTNPSVQGPRISIHLSDLRHPLKSDRTQRGKFPAAERCGRTIS